MVNTDAGGHDFYDYVHIYDNRPWLAARHTAPDWRAEGRGFKPSDRTNTQGLKKTEENVLPLLWHRQMDGYSILR